MDTMMLCRHRPPSLITWLKGTRSADVLESTTQRKRLAVIPYVHKLSHGLKNVGKRYGVDVVLLELAKVSSVCSADERREVPAARSHLGCGAHLFSVAQGLFTVDSFS